MTDDETLEGDLGLVEYKLEGPTSREYFGWHLPRKQVVRHAHWAEPLRNILNARIPRATVLKYLGLPGRDLLDVRHLLDQLCKPEGRQVMFLGFDRAADAESPHNVALNTAYADLMRDDLVVAQSVVRKDDVMAIVDASSVVFRDIARNAPYDVVNLDFCEAVLGGNDKIFDLFQRIFTIQQGPNEWLLLFTTFLDLESFNPATLKALRRLIELDVETCEGMDAALAEMLNLEVAEARDLARDHEPATFFVLGSVMAGTWLLREAAKAGFRIKAVRACGYAIKSQAGGMDMLSLSINFAQSYAIKADDAGLVSADEVDECSEKIANMLKFSRIEDVDVYLKDEDKLEQFTEQTMELMRSANHQVAAFAQFLIDKGVPIDIVERVKSKIGTPGES